MCNAWKLHRALSYGWQDEYANDNLLSLFASQNAYQWVKGTVDAVDSVVGGPTHDSIVVFKQ